MTLCGHSLCWVCVCAGQRIPLSALVRNPNKGPELEISQVTGSRGGKEGPREDRESQPTEQDRRDQSAWDSSPGEGRSVREHSQRWVGITRGFVEVSRKIHARDSLQMHGKLHEKRYTDSPSLHLELTQVRVCSFVLSSTLFGCILCGCKKKCVIPLVENEKKNNTWWITDHEKFNDFEIVGGRPARGVVTAVRTDMQIFFMNKIFQILYNRIMYILKYDVKKTLYIICILCILQFFVFFKDFMNNNFLNWNIVG